MTSRDSQVIKCDITPNSEIIWSDKDSLEEMNGGLVLSMQKVKHNENKEWK